MPAVTDKLLSSKSGVVSGGDWSLGVDACWDDIKDAGGGVIVFDEKHVSGNTKLITGVPMQSKAVPITFKGKPQTRVQPDTATNVTVFNLADMPSHKVEDMVFVGDEDISTPRSTDVGALFYWGYILHAVVRDTVFAGIKSFGNLLEVGNGANLSMYNCHISGCAGTILVANQAYGLDIDTCYFMDYFGIDTAFHDKSTDGAAWIHVHDPAPGMVGENTPRIRIANSHFDEASFKGIFVEEYPIVVIDRCTINISSSGSGIGIHVKNAKLVIIANCHVGYNLVPNNPMVKIENCDKVIISGLTKDDVVNAPYKVHCDAYSYGRTKLIGCDEDIVKLEV